MATKNASRDRFKYGICLNEDCPMSKTKEVQQISMRSELVCKECGQELRECPPPKKFNPKPIIIAIIALVVLGGGGVAVYFGLSKKTVEEKLVEEVVVDEVVEVVEPTPVVEEKAQTPEPQTPKPQGYTWTGEWKNGKAHGVGTYTYKVETLIDKRDPQKRVAKVGDYIIGEYHRGKLVQGRWYDKDNNLKGSIIIGM
mgnify:CR=1 FL=1